MTAPTYPAFSVDSFNLDADANVAYDPGQGERWRWSARTTVDGVEREVTVSADHKYTAADHPTMAAEVANQLHDSGVI